MPRVCRGGLWPFERQILGKTRLVVPLVGRFEKRHNINANSPVIIILIRIIIAFLCLHCNVSRFLAEVYCCTPYFRHSLLPGQQWQWKLKTLSRDFHDPAEFQKVSRSYTHFPTIIAPPSPQETDAMWTAFACHEVFTTRPLSRASSAEHSFTASRHRSNSSQLSSHPAIDAESMNTVHNTMCET